jgi:hypothetical protein
MKFIRTFEELSPEVYRSAADSREKSGDPYMTADDLRKHADDIESGKFPVKHLLYYAFDWDDNILEMPTEIMVLTEDGGEIGMSTSDFAEHRSKLGVEDFEYKGKIVVGIDNETAFRNFRDENDHNVFKNDVIKAIESNSISPSWDDFMECLSNGSLFAIITARGHEKEAMKSGVEWIIDNILTKKTSKRNLNLSLADEMYNNLRKFAHLYGDNTKYDHFLTGQPSQHPLVKIYLDNCDFVGVSAPSRGGSPANPEAAKEEALTSFIKKVSSFAGKIGLKAMVGFSDDDPKNVKHIEEAFEDLKKSIGNEDLSNIIKLVLKGVGKASLKVDYTNESYIKKFEDFSPAVLNTMPNAAKSGGINSRNPDETSKIQQSNILNKISQEIFGKHEENKEKRDIKKIIYKNKKNKK